VVRGFKTNRIGANDHLVEFGGGRVEAVKLIYATWRVDCGAQCGVPALAAKVMEAEAEAQRAELLRLRAQFPPMTDATIREAVKAFWVEGGGQAKADFLHSPNAEARYGPVSAWDVSGVSTMRELFCGCRSFAADVSGWDVSGVTNMISVFDNCQSFAADVLDWDVAGVQDMRYLFCNCPRFTANLSAWRVGAGTHTRGMFRGADAFDRKGAPWAKPEAFNA
jgi:surface protein